MIVSGRSVGALRTVGMPAYRQFGEAARVVVTELERVLSVAVGNPPLFTMALELTAAGHEVTSVASVYAGFVDRLAQNARVPNGGTRPS